MNKNIKTTIVIFTIAILVIFIGFFLLDYEDVALNYWTFGAVIFSLLMMMIAVILRFSSKCVHTLGLSAATILYGIAILISVLCKGAFKAQLNGFIFLQIVINALFAITLIILVSISSNKVIETSNKKN